MHVQALMKQWCIDCRTYYYNEQYVNTPAIIIPVRTYEASRGAVAQCDCKRDWSWFQSPLGKLNIYLNLYIHFF